MAEFGKLIDLFAGAGYRLPSTDTILASGKVTAYAAGTITDKTVWTDRAKTTPAAQPFILGSDGRAEVYGDGVYDFVITTAADVAVETIEDAEYSPGVSASNPESFAILSDLRAYTGDSTAAETFGYNSVGDGGHGSWRWDASDLTAAVAADTYMVLYASPDSDNTGASGAWARVYSGDINVRWGGTAADFNVATRVGTDDAAIFNAVAVLCKTAQKTMYIPNGNYLVNSTVLFDAISVRGEEPLNTTLYANTEITIAQFLGSRKTIDNLNLWFSLAATAGATAIGAKFGGSTYGTAADQFSNNKVTHLYCRYAYQPYISNVTGVTGTLWNNTFINCRADFPVNYGWYFAAIVGSTTQTWINCMIDGVNTVAAPSKGWYTDNIDDVMWLNCQADDMYDGDAIHVNLASNATINNLRMEASALRTSNAQMVYLNCKAEVNNLKFQSSEIAVGAGNNANIVRFGSGGSGNVGGITSEALTITSGNLVKVNTNGVQTGDGRVIISGDGIQRADVVRDDVGNRTVFANKSVRFGVTAVDPTVGTYEIGDTFSTVALTGTGVKYRRVCNLAGTLGTLAGVTAGTTAGSAAISVSAITDLAEGMFINIVGVTGDKRIVHIQSASVVYIDVVADATVAGAAASYATPTFKVLDYLVNKGATAQRPSLVATDIGILYLDTDLAANGQPIWWNGTLWVDEAGVSV